MRGQNWTGLLETIGLGSPGYAEAVEATNRKTAERKRRVEKEREAKTRKNKRK